MPGETQQDEVTHGAFIPPSDAYCSPRLVDTDSNDEWILRPIEELEEHGVGRCQVCVEKGGFDA